MAEVDKQPHLRYLLKVSHTTTVGFRSARGICSQTSVDGKFGVQLYLSVSVRTIVCLDPSLRYTSMLLGRYSNQHTTTSRTSQADRSVEPVMLVVKVAVSFLAYSATHTRLWSNSLCRV